MTNVREENEAISNSQLSTVQVKCLQSQLKYDENNIHFCPTLYPLDNAAGGSMDWVHDSLGVTYAYGPELRPGRDYWGNGFIYPARYIRPSGLEFSRGWLNAILSMRK